MVHKDVYFPVEHFSYGIKSGADEVQKILH